MYITSPFPRDTAPSGPVDAFVKVSRNSLCGLKSAYFAAFSSRRPRKKLFSTGASCRSRLRHSVFGLCAHFSVPESSFSESARTVQNSAVPPEHSGELKQSLFVEQVVESTADLLEFGQVLECVSKSALSKTGKRRWLEETLKKSLLLLSKAESERLLRLTDQVLTIERRAVNSPFEVLRELPEVEELLQRINKKGVLEGKELLEIAQFLHVSHRLRRNCASSDLGNPDSMTDFVAADEFRIMEIKDNETTPMQLEAADLFELLHQVQPSISVASEIFTVLDEDGRPRDTASAELRDIRLQLHQTKERIREELQRIIQKKGDALQDRTPTVRYDRQVLPVKATLKPRIPGVVHDYSSSGNTIFIEPQEIVELNNDLRRLARKESAVEREVWNQLSKRLQPLSGRLDTTFKTLIEIDMAVARARYAQVIGASPTRFAESDEAPIQIRCVCHPLLLWRSLHSSEKTVPIDFQIRGSCRAAILTGANAGGKTLAVKTLGLVALMAKSGLPIPRRLGEHSPKTGAILDDTVTVPYFDRVLADIGDEQSLQQNLSTFSGHLQRIRGILRHATPSSLILLDELGAGTDPAEGAALGIALLRFLVEGQRVRFVFVTTHHSELKTLHFQNPALFENVSVEFDTDRLEPTYRLLWGVAGKSYALLVARKLGFHSEVLHEAEALLEKSIESGGSADVLQTHSDSTAVPQNRSRLIDQIEKIRMEQLQILEKAKIEEEELKRIRLEYEQRLGDVARERQRIIEEQQLALEAELGEVRTELKEALERLKRNDLDSSRANQQMKELESKVEMESSRLSELALGTRNKSHLDRIEENDLVLVPRFGQSFLRVVQKVSDERLRVSLGNMFATINVDEITSIRRTASSYPETAAGHLKPRPVVTKREFESSTAAPIQVRTQVNTIDIRGMRAHEVESALEMAIDRGLQMGSLWIIHGHGTGRLRKTVREYLRNHPNVSSFREANPSDGGSGVTVAVLK
ncbi:hypothetical protein CCYA_CCYA07G2057 [Cyanidiococcus yangmingshanensis]|nr:hypothetical protein CCYA_CCYA07G2057 [Cyanidiococcus yangmingshanensis]